MKYRLIDMDNLCNHKMIATDNMTDVQKIVLKEQLDQELMGIAKRWVIDKRFDFESQDKYYNKMKFRLIGGRGKYDNISCQNQEIDLPCADKKNIAILGFCGYHTYKEKFKFITNSGECIIQRMQLYHYMECMDSLYDSEKDDDCTRWITAKLNIYASMKYYKTSHALPENTCKLILPDNPDMHIAAITLY